MRKGSQTPRTRSATRPGEALTLLFTGTDSKHGGKGIVPGHLVSVAASLRADDLSLKGLPMVTNVNF